MFKFDPRSKVVEVHSNNRNESFQVHECLLRQKFKNYDLMINQAIRTTGTPSVQVEMSDGALALWIEWLYGLPMDDRDDTDDPDLLEQQLEIYEYCHGRSPSEIDHKCANACLDAICETLDSYFQIENVDQVFRDGASPTLVELVTKLDQPSGEGLQMLVDVLAHRYASDPGVLALIRNTELVPCLAPFFHKLSYAATVRNYNAAQEGGPECAVSTPDPMSSHAYHSHSD